MEVRWVAAERVIALAGGPQEKGRKRRPTFTWSLSCDRNRVATRGATNVPQQLSLVQKKSDKEKNNTLRLSPMRVRLLRSSDHILCPSITRQKAITFCLSLLPVCEYWELQICPCLCQSNLEKHLVWPVSAMDKNFAPTQSD